jgi:hypothetical protein
MGQERAMNTESQLPWWQTKMGMVLIGFLAVAGFFIATEHTAHLYGALPYLLLLACPLMHLFMHGGHGHHGSHQAGSSGDKATGGKP